ncbi:MAG: hypothetical protein A2X49_12810 [Lentisphaerae bacterium GWF2_52_8]|nr:MAG: hypothetical protein A2X49_12810 [Lentisphaerae bacterium GWF2_52_8]
MTHDVSIRPLKRKDRAALEKIIRATNVFTEAEVDVALELIDIALDKKDQKDYIIFTAEKDGAVAGYVCFGPAAATEGTYDLYWIAVDPTIHRSGIGKMLLKFCEEQVAQRGGRMIIIETSSMEKYSPTREFYIRNGYEVAAIIKDFYRVGDDRCIFVKRKQNDEKKF